MTRVDTYAASRSIIEDLDVRASDLLQANVVVWVEGPSDRILFNRWIDLWSDGCLQEHVHYECLTYGGSLIANWSFNDPQGVDTLMSALRINAHSIVIVDSDRETANDKLKTNADRVLEEARKSGGIGWATAGREVENYIPLKALKAFCEMPDLVGPAQYECLYDHFDAASPKFRGFRDRKAEFARKISAHITLDGMRETLDLKDQIGTVAAQIAAWNGLDSLSPE